MGNICTKLDNDWETVLQISFHTFSGLLFHKKACNNEWQKHKSNASMQVHYPVFMKMKTLTMWQNFLFIGPYFT